MSAAVPGRRERTPRWPRRPRATSGRPNAASSDCSACVIADCVTCMRAAVFGQRSELLEVLEQHEVAHAELREAGGQGGVLILVC